MNSDATLAECRQLIRVSPIKQCTNRARWADFEILEIALGSQTWQCNQAYERRNVVGEKQIAQVVFSAINLQRLLERSNHPNRVRKLDCESLIRVLDVAQNNVFPFIASAL